MVRTEFRAGVVMQRYFIPDRRAPSLEIAFSGHGVFVACLAIFLPVIASANFLCRVPLHSP